MKKLIAIGVVAMLALPLAGGVAQAGKKAKKPVQVIEGSVALPSPFVQSVAPGGSGVPFDGCWGGLTRQTTGQTGNPNGVTGYFFDIDPKSWNKPFKLEATGGEGTVDFDLFMYYTFPGAGETAASTDFQTREEGGEAGKVPPNAAKGLICLYGGDVYYGYNATFNYTAG